MVQVFEKFCEDGSQNSSRKKNQVLARMAHIFFKIFENCSTACCIGDSLPNHKSEPVRNTIEHPGLEGLSACILHNKGCGTYGVVYWISAANIVDVTLQHYKHVTSMAQVTATACGLNGATYNYAGQVEVKIWIGIQSSPITVGTVSGTAIKGSREVPELTPLPRGFAVCPKSSPEPLPHSTEA